jgi:hypothetical protein
VSTTNLSLRRERDFVRWVAAEGVSLVWTAVTTVVLHGLLDRAQSGRYERTLQ